MLHLKMINKEERNALQAFTALLALFPHCPAQLAHSPQLQDQSVLIAVCLALKDTTATLRV